MFGKRLNLYFLDFKMKQIFRHYILLLVSFIFKESLIGREFIFILLLLAHLRSHASLHDQNELIKMVM